MDPSGDGELSLREVERGLARVDQREPHELLEEDVGATAACLERFLDLKVGARSRSRARPNAFPSPLSLSLSR